MKLKYRCIFLFIVVLVGWGAYRTGLYNANNQLIKSSIVGYHTSDLGTSTTAMYMPLSIYGDSTSMKLYINYLLGREKINQSHSFESMMYCKKITDNGIQNIEVIDGKAEHVKIGNQEFIEGELISTN